MSYDVAAPTSREYFRELDRRVFVRRVRSKPYGQDAELLPLPHGVRVRITDRMPWRVRDAVLNCFVHRLAATGVMPA